MTDSDPGATDAVDASSEFIPYLHTLMGMAKEATSTRERDDTTLCVSRELRDEIRVEKAKAGESYDDYLSRHLPIETDQ